MIRFLCSSCQMALAAPDNRVGRRVKCPYCAFPIAVPSDVGKRALPRNTTSWQRPIMLGTLFVFVLGGLLLYWGAR